MTSEGETQKTSEFLRRRKLRLQQVREQSKDIAKKIRQRAKVETLRHIVELDEKKERDYIQSQDKVVKKLEELYSRGLDNVGSSHKKALRVTQPEDLAVKTDLSHIRGREATAELRKQKQEKFNELKKTLDRRVQARTAANVLSREKSTTAANKLSTKSSSAKLKVDETTKPTENLTEDNVFNDIDLPKEVSKNDMGTQWDVELLSPSWEPNIPTVAIPQDDSIKESVADSDKNPDQQKRPNLFALSDEMPPSLCGGTHKSCDTEPSKLSSTLVSEYIQNRVLRLRESEDSISTKKKTEDLKNLRQTIIRSRPLKSKVTSNNDPLLRDKGSDNLLPKKKTITIYNHSTRDARDVAGAGEQMVHRDGLSEKDAYSQALSESTSECIQEKRKTHLETANKIAITRQNIEKEYNDTIAFLKTLPKNKNSKLIKNAYKDDHRLQAQRENRQRILQQEFKDVEQDSRKTGLPKCTMKSSLPDRSYTKRTKSPSNLNDEINFKDRDFQYSWMPVPESDSNLAVHTIPTAVRPSRPGGSVKFSKVDSYHEYRSRHKHTPPTKDTGSFDKKTNKRIVETVIFQKDEDSLSGLSITSDNSSAGAPVTGSKSNDDVNNSPPKTELSDAERIIIYKILNCKHRKKNNTAKINRTDDVVQKSAVRDEKEKVTESCIKETVGGNIIEHKKDDGCIAANNPLNSDNLFEGLYEVVGNTEDNLESMYYAELNKNVSNTNGNMRDKHKKGCCTRRTSTEKDFLHSRKKCTASESKSYNPEVGAAAETSSIPAKNSAARAGDSCSHEPGFVKLIEEGEKQEGNFYIGATGFLKDDAYEVIIQLRKKDVVKETTKKDGEVFEQKTTDGGTENTINTKTISAQSLEPKLLEQEVITCNEQNPVLADQQRSIDPDFIAKTDMPTENLTQDSKSTEKSRNSDDVPSAKIQHDRSVSTSFIKDIYPSSEPLVNSDPRPATSTYTQTTPSSPNPRPVYIHMSSSTSTAYMSPPEVVLPNFFKRGYESCRKAHRPYQNIDQHVEKKLNRQEHHCKMLKKKVIERTTDQVQSSTYFTSPIDIGYGTYNMYKDNKESTLSSSVSHITHNKCLKCKKRGDYKHCPYCKQYRHKNKQQLKTAKLSKSVWSAKKTGLRSNKSKTHLHSNKSYLNPRIKDYIHKLLSLNREGIKAIQVMNQDCSSVNTPGSSIVNVPTNLNNNSHRRNLDFSLEQIKHVLRQRIFLNNNFSYPKHKATEKEIPKNETLKKKYSKKKKLHKVKSLNISKRITIKPSNVADNTRVSENSETRLANNQKTQVSLSQSKIKNDGESIIGNTTLKAQTASKPLRAINPQYPGDDISSGHVKMAISSENTTSHTNDASTRNKCIGQPINTSTQTSRTVDDEMNFIKLAEDKLQNMEKIADLTEKCSKRLSNLAKVLEEVRKNKSLAYSQMSTPDSTSDSDQRSDKVFAAPSSISKFPPDVSTVQSSKDEYKVDSTYYESLLAGVPKPGNIQSSDNTHTYEVLPNNINTYSTTKPVAPIIINEDCRLNNNNTKCRNKPPPALLRINLKRPQENVVPHELSTVMEVDSPLSVKFKSQSSTTNINQSTKNIPDTKKDEKSSDEHVLDRELTTNKTNHDKVKAISTDSSGNSKLQMMDLNQFNEIMLRPFVSLQEYAQDYYESNLDTKYESNPKDNGFTDDISSLHSDGSLPDVVAELLKRKLITEPFKFDTASNVNSTTISSESTLSVLASSKVRKDRNKSKLTANKENVGEVSDSLSISSNPDLENAFKKLGMGWASSTLKKTKERLALSSSSNTSSSSLSHIIFKNSSKHDGLVADSVSSVPNLTKKSVLKRQLESSKNAEQQTSFTNSMTVKEFLKKELAKKITFTNKSDRNDTNLEFVSLYETKLPEEQKKSPQTMLEDNSGGSGPSGNNNRARTSTPVNIFKSVTYHSSSSSNVSNGLFSNADDLSSVKLTSTSMRYQSTSEKDELTIPNCSLKMRKASSDCSKTDSC